jgi:hypothetical protein
MTKRKGSLIAPGDIHASAYDRHMGRGATTVMLAALGLLGAVGCSRAARAQEEAWSHLPPGARDATQHTEKPKRAEGPFGGGTIYVIDARMTEPEFRAWCGALGYSVGVSFAEPRAKAAPAPSVAEQCEASGESVHRLIEFEQEPGSALGDAKFLASGF